MKNVKGMGLYCYQDNLEVNKSRNARNIITKYGNKLLYIMGVDVGRSMRHTPGGK